MAEGERRDEGSGWLPPEPAGGEGDRTEPLPPSPPPPTQLTQPQHPPYQGPAGGFQQPQQGYGQPAPPPGYGQQPPGYGPPGAPPGYPQQPQAGWGPAGYAPVRPPEPGNGQAVAGFVLAVTAATLLVISFGFLWIISLPCAITAIFLGRAGMRSVDRGDTRKHRGLGQAAFIVGLVTTPLSLLALAGCVALIASEDLQRDLEDLDQSQTRAALQLEVSAARDTGRIPAV